MSQQITAKYVFLGNITKNLLVEDTFNIRVSVEAKPKFAEYMDNGIKLAVNLLIRKIPTKNGKPRRQTIQVEDLRNSVPITKSEYVKMKPIYNDLLEYDGLKIRIARDAKELFIRYCQLHVRLLVSDLLKKLPRHTKGEKKGTLKRITLHPEDFT